MEVTQLTQANTEGGGNTNSPQKNTRSRKWCLTLNNYSDDEHYTLTQVGLTCKKYIIGKEVGQEGTRHLQIYFHFKDAKSFMYIKKACPRAHIEVAKGSDEDNLKYCSKEGNYITNIEAEKTAEEEYEAFMQEEYKDITWKPWQNEIVEMLEQKPNKRQINWFYEETGNAGKSFLSKYLDWKYDAIIVGGKQSDVFNGIRTYLEEKKRQPKLIIIDIPRTCENYVCYGTLEKIKDGLLYSGKYEGAKIRLIPCHLICFANFKPDTSTMSEDRWNIKNIANQE